MQSEQGLPLVHCNNCFDYMLNICAQAAAVAVLVGGYWDARTNCGNMGLSCAL
jgi:hypothetical protein